MSEKFNDWTKISSERGVDYIEKDIDGAVVYFSTYYGMAIGDSECPCCGHVVTVKVEKIDFDAMHAEYSEGLKIGKNSRVTLGVEVDEYFEERDVK